MTLRDRVAVVTGAGSGFGAGIARRFAAEGARVMVADIDGAAAEAVCDAIGAAATPCTADVSRRDQMDALVETTLEKHGALHVMVNNAGVSHLNRPLLEVDEQTFDRVYAVNVKSVYLSALACVPVFRAQGGGNILNIASTAGISPRPGLTWYNGSKGAVITLTKSMAVELAPDDIRVNAICPVIGDTGLTKTFMGGEDTPEIRRKFLASIPLGRFSQPDDIAAAAAFLVSDEASLITGVALEVDGGRCI